MFRTGWLDVYQLFENLLLLKDFFIVLKYTQFVFAGNSPPPGHPYKQSIWDFIACYVTALIENRSKMWCDFTKDLYYESYCSVPL